MITFIRKKLSGSHFARAEEGAIAIETMIMMPLMFWTFMALFSTFDTYRQYAIHQKAAYTISDMLSRETMPIDNDYIDGTHKIFDALTRTVQDSKIRVTVVRYDAVLEDIVVEWTETRGGVTDASFMANRDWAEVLPMMLNDEELIVVETYAKYDPPFRTGLGEKEINNFIFTRPRFAPQVEFDDGTVSPSS